MFIALCALALVTVLIGWATIRLALDLHDTRQALAIVIDGLQEAGLLDVAEEEE